MSSAFTSHVYRNDAVLPLPGEVIRIHYSISSLNFNFGPSSDGSLGTRSSAVTQPNPTGRRGKPPFHYVIVSAVFVSPSGTIDMQFFPVASYAKPPRGYAGTNWNAATWMESQPEGVTLQHLPIPAVDWCPTPHPVWGPDPLNFGSWLNQKPAWVLVVQRSLSIPVTDTWKRLSPPVMLSPAHLTALRGFHANANAYLFSHQHVVSVNHASLPEYGPVWAGIVGHGGYPDYDPETDSDSGGSDDSGEIDPVSMWRFDGAPKAMRDMVERDDEAVKQVLKERISLWVVSVQEPCEQGDADCVEDLDADMEINVVS